MKLENYQTTLIESLHIIDFSLINTPERMELFQLFYGIYHRNFIRAKIITSNNTIILFTEKLISAKTSIK
jgi:hypothetical protein